MWRAKRARSTTLRSCNPSPITCSKSVAPTGRCREMPHADLRADRGFVAIEVGLDRAQRRVFHELNHDRRRKDRGETRVLECVCEILAPDDRLERPLCTDRN